MKNFKLRDYQNQASRDGVEILNKYKILILNFEVRTGKTHIALDIAKNYERVLFVTTKKAISSIEGDYSDANHSFNITIINYESLHKIEGVFDLVICDESHKLGAYPKPSKRTKLVRDFVTNDLILLTGTLMPESNSQIYHQLWISKFSPFGELKNFYAWHKLFGEFKQLRTSYGLSNDYSEVNWNNIKNFVEPLKLSYTQKDAGFTSKVNEHILWSEMSVTSKHIINVLKKDKVITSPNTGEVILADTGAKMMSKIHQLCSGTIKFESGNSRVIDNSKALLIKSMFNEQKIVIFYKFKEELNAIKSVFRGDITTDLQEFNETTKSIALQVVSGREGINLSKAESLVYYNIDFSAVSYWQSRDRLTTKDRLENNVYWIFSKGGIESKIYKAVLNKKDYTLQTFRNDRAEITG